MGHKETPQQLWIQAAMQASQGPEVRVQCPSCKQGTLVVFDLAPAPDSPKVERGFYCPTCQARNHAFMNRKPEQNGRFVEFLPQDPEDVQEQKWQLVLEQAIDTDHVQS